ncbi:MAG: LysR family transcriptional regulator [Smithellaceae bacterium]
MKIKHKIWFEAHGLTIFGPGRNSFFKQIDECRSLNSAAKKLNVSYRLAWGKIKVAEERLGIHLVEVNPGENKLHLTEGARELLAIFDDLEKEITPILHKAEDKILALKKKSQKSKALTESKITAKNTSSDSPAACLTPEPERQNRLQRLTLKDRRHEGNKKIVIKSMVYLYILPFVETVCELFEDYAVIVCF